MSETVPPASAALQRAAEETAKGGAAAEETAGLETPAESHRNQVLRLLDQRMGLESPPEPDGLKKSGPEYRALRKRLPQQQPDDAW